MTPSTDLRLVELFLANHFQYTWFDPMTLFPARDIDLLGSDDHLYRRYCLRDRWSGHPPGYYRDMPTCDTHVRDCNG